MDLGRNSKYVFFFFTIDASGIRDVSCIIFSFDKSHKYKKVYQQRFMEQWINLLFGKLYRIAQYLYKKY